jgi:hypothetical protein
MKTAGLDRVFLCKTREFTEKDRNYVSQVPICLNHAAIADGAVLQPSCLILAVAAFSA